MLKVYTHGFVPQPTFGGVAPWIVKRLARRRRLNVDVEARIFSRQHYQAMLEDTIRDLPPIQAIFWSRQRPIIANTFYFRVLVHQLQPAVYLLLDSQHAVYSETVPKHGTPIMALQLYGKEG